MSYSTWTTYGFGFCASDINTTPEKLMKLASIDQEVLADIKESFLYEFGNVPKIEDLTIEDFNELEGDYGEYGIAYVLKQVIDEIPIDVVNDYDGNWYILYCPTFPWNMQKQELDLTSAKVAAIFQRYIDILTDEYIEIDFQTVENGG